MGCTPACLLAVACLPAVQHHNPAAKPSADPPLRASLPPLSPLLLSVCRDEDEAARALQGFQGRYYAGKPIAVEFSPVTDFREATCRQYEENCCSRGGYCNFMHVRPVSRDLRKQVGAPEPRRERWAAGHEAVRLVWEALRAGMTQLPVTD